MGFQLPELQVWEGCWSWNKLKEAEFLLLGAPPAKPPDAHGDTLNWTGFSFEEPAEIVAMAPLPTNLCSAGTCPRGGRSKLLLVCQRETHSTPFLWMEFLPPMAELCCSAEQNDATFAGVTAECCALQKNYLNFKKSRKKIQFLIFAC